MPHLFIRDRESRFSVAKSSGYRKNVGEQVAEHGGFLVNGKKLGFHSNSDMFCTIPGDMSISSWLRSLHLFILVLDSRSRVPNGPVPQKNVGEQVPEHGHFGGNFL